MHIWIICNSLGPSGVSALAVFVAFYIKKKKKKVGRHPLHEVHISTLASNYISLVWLCSDPHVILYLKLRWIEG